MTVTATDDHELHRPTRRVLEILELLSTAPSPGLTLTEIARRMSSPANSLLPFVKTLCAKGYVNFNPASMSYMLGAKCLLFSAGFVNTSDVYSIVHEALETAARECQEICQAGILEGADVFYIAKVDSPQALRIVSSVGKHVPAPCTALGKALLCDKTRAEIEALYPEGLPVLTEFSITDMDHFMKQLETVRQGGFATDIDESLKHLRCFALPVRVNGRIDCAVSISTPDFRLTHEKEKLVKGLLIEAQDRLAKRFAYLGRGLAQQ